MSMMTFTSSLELAIIEDVKDTYQTLPVRFYLIRNLDLPRIPTIDSTVGFTPYPLPECWDIA